MAAPDPGPPDAHDLVRSLVDRYAFGEIAAAARLFGHLDAGQRDRVVHLCEFGARLLDLDAEDFDHFPGVPAALADRARRSWMPQRPDAAERGALASLLPAFTLMLEVIAVRWERGDMSHTLSVTHIVNEYLPLLIWEPVLGHAADPARLRPHVLGESSLWATDTRQCQHGGPERKAARIAVDVASRPAAEWQSYLDRHHSHVADALAACAGYCQADCTVRTRLPDQVRATLRTRVRVARRLGGSPLVGLRHAAPVGHGFGVPNRTEVLEAWEETRARIDDEALPPEERALARRVRVDDGYPLPGLPTFLSAVTDQAVHPDTLLADTRRLIADTVDPDR